MERRVYFKPAYRHAVVEQYSMSIEQDAKRPRRVKRMNRSRRERFVNVSAKRLHNTSYTRALSRISSRVRRLRVLSPLGDPAAATAAASRELSVSVRLREVINGRQFAVLRAGGEGARVFHRPLLRRPAFTGYALLQLQLPAWQCRYRSWRRTEEGGLIFPAWSLSSCER
jgi:hypothetical protein